MKISGIFTFSGWSFQSGQPVKGSKKATPLHGIAGTSGQEQDKVGQDQGDMGQEMREVGEGMGKVGHKMGAGGGLSVSRAGILEHLDACLD